jgi:hypothetical protein
MKKKSPSQQRATRKWRDKQKTRNAQVHWLIRQNEEAEQYKKRQEK